MSDWGCFDIPEDIYESTKWEVVWVDSWDGDEKVRSMSPEPISENHRFFSWLHEQEVAAGKPSGGIV